MDYIVSFIDIALWTIKLFHEIASIWYLRILLTLIVSPIVFIFVCILPNIIITKQLNEQRLSKSEAEDYRMILMGYWFFFSILFLSIYPPEVFYNMSIFFYITIPLFISLIYLLAYKFFKF